MSTKTRNLLIVAVLAVCAVAVGARQSADPALGADSGQTIKKSIWGPVQAGGKSLFPAYRDLGVGLYQYDLRWYRTALSRPADATDPADPAYKWPADLDTAVTEAAANGMQVSIRILGTPRWANGNQNARFVPNNPGDYADFAVATAKRYPSVRLWSVWGEPNRASMFGPLTPATRFKGPLNAAQQVAPRNYALLLDTTYGALKALNPANLIIGGNTFNSTGTRLIHPYQWIRYLVLPDGSRPRMDLYGHNPFCYRKPTLHAKPSPQGRVDFSDLPRFGKALDRYFPGQSLRFFLAEWGVDVGTEVEGRFRVNAKTQAKWIRAGYRIARTWDRIYTLGWVRAIDTDISTGGLMDSNGNPKPSYYVFKAS